MSVGAGPQRQEDAAEDCQYPHRAEDRLFRAGGDREELGEQAGGRIGLGSRAGIEAIPKSYASPT